MDPTFHRLKPFQDGENWTTVPEASIIPEPGIRHVNSLSMNQAMAGANGVLVITQVIPPTQQQQIQVGTSVFQNVLCQFPVPLQRFIKGEPKALGVAQILIGLMQIILGIILAISMRAIFTISVIVGIPFWAGIFFIISGSLSTAAERNRNICLVKGSLGMNIISSIAAFLGFIFYAIDLGICSIYGWFSEGEHGGMYEDHSRRIAQSFVAVVKGIEALLLLLVLVEFCISISTSVFGCKAVCRDSTSDMPVIIMQNEPRLEATCPPVTPPPMYNEKDQFQCP
ncbi:membrane-spanning 4-domains subfamily A member 4A-like [Lissotriton helveticus]